VVSWPVRRTLCFSGREPPMSGPSTTQIRCGKAVDRRSSEIEHEFERIMRCCEGQFVGRRRRSPNPKGSQLRYVTCFRAYRKLVVVERLIMLGAHNLAPLPLSFNATSRQMDCAQHCRTHVVRKLSTDLDVTASRERARFDVRGFIRTGTILKR
jgi:hypothetical protein